MCERWGGGGGRGGVGGGRERRVGVGVGELNVNLIVSVPDFTYLLQIILFFVFVYICESLQEYNIR